MDKVLPAERSFVRVDLGVLPFQFGPEERAYLFRLSSGGKALLTENAYRNPGMLIRGFGFFLSTIS